MIAFARASRNAISTPLSPSETQPHFLNKSMSLSTKGEIAATSLGKERSSSRQGPTSLRAIVIRKPPRRDLFFSSVGRECSSEHGPLAYRLFFCLFILNDVPMLDEGSVVNAHNICGNPIHRSAETAKPPVDDHDVSLCHDRSRFVLQRWRKALDEIEQTVAARCDMIAVLDVVRRPESFRGRIIALVKECVERFQDEGLVLFGRSLRHLDSFHTSEITSIASTREG